MKLINGINIEPLCKAANSFMDAMGRVTDDLTRDGAIQRFEYSFELCWKTMKRLLREKGSDVNHPRDVFREAAAESMIKDPKVWFGFLEKRNKTTHIYKEAVAKEVFDSLPEFQSELELFLDYLDKLK